MSGAFSECSISPVTETCNGVNDDCDGATDEGLTVSCFEDSDNDGFAGTGAAQSDQCPDSSRVDVGGMEHLLRGFYDTWKAGIEAINKDVIKSFADGRVEEPVPDGDARVRHAKVAQHIECCIADEALPVVAHRAQRESVAFGAEVASA